MAAVLLFLVIPESGRQPVISKPGSEHIDRYRDLNDLHLRYAEKNGIRPFTTDKKFHEEVGNLVKRNKLVKISDNNYYVIKHLTHSHPYLVPEAAEMLELIGKRFRKKLDERNMERYLFRITSVLRTEESQKSLGRRNRNATGISAHTYGTTVDITYQHLVIKSMFGRKKLVSDPAAMALLSTVIGELRQEKKLVVVTEKKEPCFHITVR